MPNPQFVRRDGRRFVVGDQEFKFVGFNIRGLAHYGYGDGILPESTAGQREEFLAEAQAVGSAVNRILESMGGQENRNAELTCTELTCSLLETGNWDPRVIARRSPSGELSLFIDATGNLAGGWVTDATREAAEASPCP